MKTTIAILALLCVAVLSFAACASESAPEPTSEAPIVTTDEASETSATSETSTAPEEPLDPVSEAKAELERKGWENIRVVEGHMDYRQWGALILEPTDEEKDWSIVNVMGQVDGMYNNPITAIIKIAFSKEEPVGERYQAFYVSQGGRVKDTYYDSDAGKVRVIDQKEIVSADDEDLWHYMYSY